MRRKGFSTCLSESVASARILLLVNYRPEYRHEWGQKTYYTQLRLAPFGKAEAEEFLDVLVRADLWQRGDAGAPLQALKHSSWTRPKARRSSWKRWCRTLAERGRVDRLSRGSYRAARERTTDAAYSPTVQGVLAARIDRLAPEEKALLQQLAVIGREFPLSLCAKLSPNPKTNCTACSPPSSAKSFSTNSPRFPKSSTSSSMR